MNPLTDQQESVLILLVIFASFGVLYFLLSPVVFLICAALGIGVGALGAIPIYVAHSKSKRLGARIGLFAFLLMFLVPLAYLLPRLDWSVLSVFGAILMTALAFLFLYYSLLLPMALVDLREKQDATVDPPHPAVSVIVPAYNEEDCIGASIDALKATDYPPEAKEIIVVDDGSTDGTYQEATIHADETVTVLSKPNGGKHSALNHGLDHASGEIVVTIDADSLLGRDGIKRIVSKFQDDEEIGAVAGDISVANRGSFITELQELEYIAGIQLFRRAFNLTGTVVVIPGAFGAFRRRVIEGVGRFDNDTLTEDRDATVKVLKEGYRAEAIDAGCLTEAPETWTDLYKQRLRWYRGTVQTILKHRDVFHRPDLGFLYSFAFPMEVFTVAGIPIIGMVIVTAIVLELLFGSVVLVVSLFGFFTGLQALVSLLAVRIGGRDVALTALAPLFVLGYRQFLDIVMLKSVIDVLSGRDLSWTGPERTGRLDDLLSSERGSE